MKVNTLISILQTLPMDSVVQLSYFVDAYEPPQIDDIHSVTFKEAETFEKYPNSNRPNRVILS
jgi:hypothetical protein